MAKYKVCVQVFTTVIVEVSASSKAKAMSRAEMEVEESAKKGEFSQDLIAEVVDEDSVERL